MRRLKLAGMALIAVFAFGPAQGESLSDALIAAYRTSNLLDQNEALLRATDEDVAIAVAQLRPVLSFVASANYNFSVSGGQSFFGPITRTSTDNTSAQAQLTLDLTIYDFGRGRLAVDAAKETVLATREALVDLEQRVLITAVQSFVNVRLASEIVFLRQSNVRLINQELQAARDRFEVGEITRTDVAIAESRQAQARANLAAAEGDLMVAREAYKASVGAYPGQLSTPPRPPATASSLDEARSVAVRTHPRLKQSQREVTISEINVARAKAGTRPTISGRAATGLADQSFGDGGDLVGTNTLSLTFNQTIYAGGQLAAVYRRALASQEAAKSALLQTTVGIEEDVGNAWANLLVAQAQIEATDRQIRAAQIAFDGLREEAKLGARTALDVLDAEQELLDAKVARATADATRYLGVYSLLQSMGLLTVDHLNLGIPTYDPAAYYRAVKDAPSHSVQGKRLDRILKSIGEN